MSITSLTFGKEFTAAIEAKQVAAQEAERAKFVVEKAEQDKRSAVIRAQVRRNREFLCSYCCGAWYMFLLFLYFHVEYIRKKCYLLFYLAPKLALSYLSVLLIMMLDTSLVTNNNCLCSQIWLCLMWVLKSKNTNKCP